jgi:hypothetical protein
MIHAPAGPCGSSRSAACAPAAFDGSDRDYFFPRVGNGRRRRCFARRGEVSPLVRAAASRTHPSQRNPGSATPPDAAVPRETVPAIFPAQTPKFVEQSASICAVLTLLPAFRPAGPRGSLRCVAGVRRSSLTILRAALSFHATRQHKLSRRVRTSTQRK